MRYHILNMSLAVRNKEGDYCFKLSRLATLLLLYSYVYILTYKIYKWGMNIKTSGRQNIIHHQLRSPTVFLLLLLKLTKDVKNI